MDERRARLNKFNSQDMKTFFTAEDRARAFGGMKPPNRNK